MSRMFIIILMLLGPWTSAAQAQDPIPAFTPVEGDAAIGDLPMQRGEALRHVSMHYRTLGQPRRNAAGRVTNAILLLHGTGGTGATFLSPQFAGELFGPGQPMDISRY